MAVSMAGAMVTERAQPMSNNRRTTMAVRKNWKYTRGGVERTLSVGGFVVLRRGGYYTDADGREVWRGPEEDEIVTIVGIGKHYDETYRNAVEITYLNSNGKICDRHALYSDDYRRYSDHGYHGKRFWSIDEERPPLKEMP